MAFVINTSGRSFYTQLTERVGDSKKLVRGKKFAFHTGELPSVEDDDWKTRKEKPFIQEKIDNEELETGSRAKKKGGKAADAIKDADENAKKKGAEEADK